MQLWGRRPGLWGGTSFLSRSYSEKWAWEPRRALQRVAKPQLRQETGCVCYRQDTGSLQPHLQTTAIVITSRARSAETNTVYLQETCENQLSSLCNLLCGCAYHPGDAWYPSYTIAPTWCASLIINGENLERLSYRVKLSQKEKNKYCIVTHICGSRKMVQTNLYAKQKHRYRHREQVYDSKRKRWDGLGDWDWQVYTTDTMCKIDNWLLCSTENPIQCSVVA